MVRRKSATSIEDTSRSRSRSHGTRKDSSVEISKIASEHEKTSKDSLEERENRKVRFSSGSCVFDVLAIEIWMAIIGHLKPIDAFILRGVSTSFRFTLAQCILQLFLENEPMLSLVAFAEAQSENNSKVDVLALPKFLEPFVLQALGSEPPRYTDDFTLWVHYDPSLEGLDRAELRDTWLRKFGGARGRSHARDHAEWEGAYNRISNDIKQSLCRAWAVLGKLYPFSKTENAHWKKKRVENDPSKRNHLFSPRTREVFSPESVTFRNDVVSPSESRNSTPLMSPQVTPMSGLVASTPPTIQESTTRRNRYSLEITTNPNIRHRNKLSLDLSESNIGSSAMYSQSLSARNNELLTSNNSFASPNSFAFLSEIVSGMPELNLDGSSGQLNRTKSSSSSLSASFTRKESLGRILIPKSHESNSSSLLNPMSPRAKTNTTGTSPKTRREGRSFGGNYDAGEDKEMLFEMDI